jgi:DNA-binding FrmR family transcriptional regulator
MIDEERYRIDILRKMQATRSALARVEDALLKDQLQLMSTG